MKAKTLQDEIERIIEHLRELELAADSADLFRLRKAQYHLGAIVYRLVKAKKSAIEGVMR